MIDSRFDRKPNDHEITTRITRNTNFEIKFSGKLQMDSKALAKRKKFIKDALSNNSFYFKNGNLKLQADWKQSE